MKENTKSIAYSDLNEMNREKEKFHFIERFFFFFFIRDSPIGFDDVRPQLKKVLKTTDVPNLGSEFHRNDL